MYLFSLHLFHLFISTFIYLFIFPVFAQKR